MRKVAGAARYRRDAGGGKPAPIAPRVAAALARAGVDAAGRDEPLATEDRLRAAGRALRGGGLYVRGRDAAGRPIVWARSGLIDLRNLGAAGERAWVDAVATLFELCALAGGGGFTRGAAPRVEGDTTRRAPLPPMRREKTRHAHRYVEAADLSPSRVPLMTGWRVLRGGLDALTTAFPERGAEFVVTGASAFNRLLFNMAKPFMPASLRTRIVMLPRGDRAAAKLAAVLGGADAIPDFLGGNAAHVLHRTDDGDVDFARAFEELLLSRP